MTNVTHKLFPMYLFLFITLYMFRAHRAHHQERQIVSIQPLVKVYVGGRDVCRLEEESSSNVILCWWSRCAQVGRRLLQTCTHIGHQHRMIVSRGCIDTICVSWWWARCVRNMQRVINRNKYIEKKFIYHVGHLPRIIRWNVVCSIVFLVLWSSHGRMIA